MEEEDEMKLEKEEGEEEDRGEEEEGKEDENNIKYEMRRIIIIIHY